MRDIGTSDIQVNKVTCFYCLAPLDFNTDNRPHKKSATIDHIIPTSRMGANVPVNRIVACAECNVTKSNMSMRKLHIYCIAHPEKGILLSQLVRLNDYIIKKGESLYAGTRIKAGKTRYKHPDAPQIEQLKVIGKIQLPMTTFEKREANKRKRKNSG